METLGSVITSNDFNPNMKRVYRLAARGIIYQNGKVLMIYSKFYNDFTFPGGGNENGEDNLLTLRRELIEEAGVTIKNIKPFYKIIENRTDNIDSYTYHESEYYLCDIAEYTNRHLCDYEVTLGYEVKWLTISEAIAADEAKKRILLSTDYDGVLKRELRILYKLKELEETNLL